jgi:hypothetical protein
MVGRHPDVHQDELGSVLTDEREQLRRISAPADHLESGTIEETREPLAEEHVVVGQRYARAARVHADDRTGYAAGCAVSGSPEV